MERVRVNNFNIRIILVHESEWMWQMLMSVTSWSVYLWNMKDKISSYLGKVYLLIALFYIGEGWVSLKVLKFYRLRPSREILFWQMLELYWRNTQVLWESQVAHYRLKNYYRKVGWLYTHIKFPVPTPMKNDLWKWQL